MFSHVVCAEHGLSKSAMHPMISCSSCNYEKVFCRGIILKEELSGLVLSGHSPYCVLNVT